MNVLSAKSGVQIVWFKRDLRAIDHAPLTRAAARGPVLPLYIVEPGWWQQADMAGRHWAFVTDALWSLRERISQLGQPFMQKLESEPRIEFENLHRAMAGLRDEVADPERLAAWRQGRTGWPLVDACIRALLHTGWINFRMRALLVSVASYQLWMHWREPALHLARLFVDYEPGIHYSQVQMQSGTIGIYTARIYNPVKQSHDQDPNGTFIRRWVPELAEVETLWIHTPWRMPLEAQRGAGCIIGEVYPAPLVDHERAAKQARERLYAKRKDSEARRESRTIFDRHGSRKRSTQRAAPRESSKLGAVGRSR